MVTQKEREDALHLPLPFSLGAKLPIGVGSATGGPETRRQLSVWGLIGSRDVICAVSSIL